MSFCLTFCNARDLHFDCKRKVAGPTEANIN